MYACNTEKKPKRPYLATMPEQHLRLSELTAEITRTITDRFSGRQYWVVADVTSHSYHPTRRSHFFELVEKEPASGNLLAKIAGKAWGLFSQTAIQYLCRDDSEKNRHAIQKDKRSAENFIKQRRRRHRNQHWLRRAWRGEPHDHDA